MNNVEKYISLPNELMQAQKDIVDTVRKETIKRVCQTLYDFCTRADNPWQEIEICKDEVLEYAKQNGIDLEVK